MEVLLKIKPLYIRAMRLPRCALLLLLILQGGSSLPVSHTHLEHEDVKVIKCIVEVLAEALSKPHPLPVSPQCLESLQRDDRLVTVLRHQNFLQELQDIAGAGANERSGKGKEEASDHAVDLQEPADQSMLMAVLSPGETVKAREEERELQSQENDITSHEAENGEKALMKKTQNGDEGVAGTVGVPEHKRVEEKDLKEDEEQKAESVEKSKAGVGTQKHWSHSRDPAVSKVYGRQEAQHHSKDVSPEEELQIMAGRDREERRDPEEGSATKRTEDSEMESLAVMENELENMAQKLHKLRHG